MKYPLLTIGLLFLTIFLFDLRKKGFFSERVEKLTPTSCRSVLVMLQRRAPDAWKSSCIGNGLQVEITPNTTELNSIKEDALRAYIYRELANAFIFIANNSLLESLERTSLVNVYLNTPSLGVNAFAPGEVVAKFNSLKDKQLISEHFAQFIKVKEVPKK